MSYDIWLEADLGGEERTRLVTLDWNYTSNVAPMWRRAMPETDGLTGMEEMNAGEAAAVLREGIARMEADPEPYRALNPENGWGDFDSQLTALRELAHACEASPQAVVAIWR